MGDEPELRLLLPEKGERAANGDGERVCELGGRGANGDGSCNACAFGELFTFGGDPDNSRGRKGGRPSWKARSSNCASQ